MLSSSLFPPVTRRALSTQLTLTGKKKKKKVSEDLWAQNDSGVEMLGDCYLEEGGFVFLDLTRYSPCSFAPLLH